MTGDADTYASMLTVSLIVAVFPFVIALLSLFDLRIGRRTRAAAIVTATFVTIMSVALVIVHLRDGHGPVTLEPMGIGAYPAHHPAPFLMGGGALAALAVLRLTTGARTKRETGRSDRREESGDQSTDDR